jgi:hypothetical protein
MNNTLEVLGDILAQLGARQNQYTKIHGNKSVILDDVIGLIRKFILKEADKDVADQPFDVLVDRRIAHIKATIQKKGKGYATDDDRFHNFKAAGRKRNQTPEQALMGMMAKHEVLVDDLVEWAGTTPEKITTKLINEKIGDNINYLILLEGLLKERIGE